VIHPTSPSSFVGWIFDGTSGFARSVHIRPLLLFLVAGIDITD